MSKRLHHTAGKSYRRRPVMALLLILAAGAILVRLTDRPAAQKVPPTGVHPTTTIPTTPRPAPPKELHATVVRVFDGDSFLVRMDGAEQQVRLQGVDCPEHGQPFGNMAKQFTRELILHKRLTIESVGRDQYDRILGHPRLPDGRRLDYELVRAGMAWWYRHYSDDPRLGELETEARRDKRGLWRDANPVPPWQWRREHRK
jgi:micrococcal nuclease